MFRTPGMRCELGNRWKSRHVLLDLVLLDLDQRVRSNETLVGRPLLQQQQSTLPFLKDG